MPGGMEWFIILVIVLVVFGGGKLAGVGKSLGSAISEFKSALRPEEEKENNTPASSGKSE
ncbi:MAG: twin-arginine translocase TatA/TatE family subunit [Candidatus Hydrogenedentes bacterium]|nr:twin-arginine translocase TatA/TatE family subunit [Candidatus Hydrogenedentota bacterium]